MRTVESRSQAFRWLRWLASACFVLLSVSSAQAQVAAGYSEYYIPGDEDNLGRVLCAYGAASYPCPNPTRTHAVISLTAWSDNTTVYYDHWENAYGFDPTNPTTADESYTVANGTALNTGDRLVFDSALMTLPRWNTYPNPPPQPPATTCNSTATLYRANGTSTVLVNRTAQTTCYDGGDHLYVAGGVVTVTRVGWLDELAARGGTVGVQGTAWEIYPVKPQLTTYVVPFGETSGWNGFQHVAVLIQATRNATTVTVDLNHDGTSDRLDWNRDGTLDVATSITLQAGQTFLLDDTSANVAAGNLAAGAIITGSDTLQVKYITGNTANTYCTRGFSAFPRGFWTKDYYLPLDQPTNTANGNTDYYLYNPNSSQITVSWQSSTASGQLTINANTAVSFRTASGGTVPVGSGLYLSGSDVFWGVGSNDADGQTHEWGFSLLPSTMVYKEHYLGWAPDCYPTAAGCASDMGAFLTPVQDNTTVFVDYSNDGTVDATYTLNSLQSQFIYDPNDGDLSGAHIWATGAFTMAYGQNSNNAPVGAPALDLGYVALPGTDFISLVLGVDKSVSPQVVPTTSGSTAVFTITVTSQKYTVDGVTVTDYMPANWQYVAGTTNIVRPNKTTSSADPTVAGVPATGQTLTWPTAQIGNPSGSSMLENQQITITFTGQTTAAFAVGALSQNRVKAVGTRTVGSPTAVNQTFTATNFAYVTYGNVGITKSSSVGATTALYPGDRFTYTTRVTNPAGSGTTLTGVTINDPLPAGVTSVAGTTVCNSTVGDRFGAVAYSNNDGTQNWTNNWAETNDDGSPSTGRLLITGGGALQLHNVPASTPSVLRTVNLAGASTATLTYDYRQTGADVGDDFDVHIYNGTAFSLLRRWTGAVAAGSDSIDISAYINAGTQVRFRARASTDYTDADDFFVVDNVLITFTFPSVSSDPPELLSGLQLAAGQSIACRFDATVDDPLPSGITSIANTASTTSAQLPIALTASVTNLVVNPSVLSASVGDRVWLDADGDGSQDIGEPGIANVEVTLKDQWGTPVDVTITDVNGRYLFSGVKAGPGYYVEVTPSTLLSGLTQSFPGTNNRSITFTLSDGQSYTDADLGYKPTSGTATFGDLVWVDANNNLVRDAGEIGIGGVTVQLYLDTNGNGVVDGVEAAVATTTTASDGSYLFFRVLTVQDAEDYIVNVATAQTPLSGYTATTATSRSYSDVHGGSAYLNADFGFRGIGVTTYTLQDRVWFDTDGDGVFDAGETGIAGVTMELLNASLQVIGTTTTAADGTFTFSGLAGGNADYTTRISDTSGVLVNYYGTTSHAQARQRAIDNLAGSIGWSSPPGSPVPLDGVAPSYGFLASRSIGDTIFYDIGNFGTQDPGENGIAGVVVSLYRDPNGNGLIDDSCAPAASCLVGTVTTDANGKYLFSGLSNAYYVVSVPIPTGYNFTGTGLDADSDGGTTGIQKGRQMTGGNILDADYGFRSTTPRTLSGRIWNDANTNGAFDGSDVGIAGVTLDVLSESTGLVVATVTTEATGNYSVSGLTNIVYTVRVTDTSSALTGYAPTYERTELTTAPFNYEESVSLVSANVTGVDFGYAKPLPTYAAVAQLRAYLDDGSVTVEWRTSLEVGTVGFHILRLDPATGQWVQLTERLVPGLVVHPQGGVYRFRDAGAPTEGRLTYALLEQDVHGRSHPYGPYTVSVSTRAASRTLDAGAAQDLRRRGFNRQAVAPTRMRQALRATVAAERRMASAQRMRRQGRIFKVTTRESGIHYLSAAAMAPALGLPAERVTSLIRTGRLTLSHRGHVGPYLPEGAGAGIYFYAEPVGSPNTDENAYWVTVSPGPTMSARPAAPGGLLTTSFTETVHPEVDQYPLLTSFQDPQRDFWVWDYLYAGYDGEDARSFTIRANGATGTGDASLSVHLLGGTDSVPGDDHHVQVFFNGQPVGEARWDGLAPFDIGFPVAAASILEGDNVVEVKAVLDGGVPESLFFVDSFDLMYERRYQAVDDALSFTAVNGTGVAVGGFSGPGVLLFDVTLPSRPVLMTGYAVSLAGDGRYEVTFGAAGASESLRYQALLPGRAQLPTGVVGWRDTGLRREANAADYVLVAPESLKEAARSLAQYRSNLGLSTMVVGLEDIYDEFNAGIAEPGAIRTFLRHATSRWSTAPRYVTLVGRGTWDYRDRRGFGDNLVPTLLVGSPDGLVASDVAYADLTGDDGIPEVALGRLPVLTAQDLLDYVAKIQAHESAASGEWQRRVLLTADNADAAGNFPADSESVAALLPPEYTAGRVHLDTTTAAAGRQAILQAVNDGVAAFNYIGHGGLDRLADENLFTSADVAGLNNAGRLPVFLAMTCSVGDFAQPGYPSLGEAMLLEKDGGAFAVWSPSGLSQNSLAVQLDRSFFRGAFVDNEKVLGDLVVRSLGELNTPGSQYMRFMYNLLGEPVSRLPE